MKRVALILIFVAGAKIVTAQFEFIAAYDLALAGSAVAATSQPSHSKNIANISGHDEWKLFFGAANKYYIKDLTPVYFSIGKSVRNNIALEGSCARLGNAAFSETFAEAAIGKRLGSKFSTGIRIQYHLWKFHDSFYHSSNSLIPSLYFHATPLKNLSFGAIILNPVRSRMNAIEKNKLPSRITTGFNYRISQKANLSFSLIQQSNLPLSSHFGAEYIFSSILFIRCGWSTAPLSQAFGFGLKLAKFYVDLGVQSQSILGNTTSIGLTVPL